MRKSGLLREREPTNRLVKLQVAPDRYDLLGLARFHEFKHQVSIGRSAPNEGDITREKCVCFLESTARYVIRRFVRPCLHVYT
jgi:hypothetical protein